ncbi:uncharacterized protein LOC116954737 isoform X2 [Petromyzon marinus]|uniref:uncharacterized protein LOC116954737 isoform X2 n=1 Tax=Petromyzon marinus TaxID=7757 RepID=UPI003F6F6990
MIMFLTDGMVFLMTFSIKNWNTGNNEKDFMTELYRRMRAKFLNMRGDVNFTLQVDRFNTVIRRVARNVVSPRAREARDTVSTVGDFNVRMATDTALNLSSPALDEVMQSISNESTDYSFGDVKVADFNPCANDTADSNDCDPHADCIPSGAGLFTCSCWAAYTTTEGARQGTECILVSTDTPISTTIPLSSSSTSPSTPTAEWNWRALVISLCVLVPTALLVITFLSRFLIGRHGTYTVQKESKVGNAVSRAGKAVACAVEGAFQRLTASTHNYSVKTQLGSSYSDSYRHLEEQ